MLHDNFMFCYGTHIMNDSSLIVSAHIAPPSHVVDKAYQFINEFKIKEIEANISLMLHFDTKSTTYYLVCHVLGQQLVDKADLDAVLDADDEEYKLNRVLVTDNAAFKLMENDSRLGRVFEDMVVEYDLSYRKNKPLKVYGGQHRIQAIKQATDLSVNQYHGVRVYFDLTREQKVEIATINNTSITVPNDLLDRMQEQLLGSQLRDWCQSVGLLSTGTDFVDSRNIQIPTVRVVRTIIVNYFLGLKSSESDFHQPIVSKSNSGIDQLYEELRNGVNWDNKNLADMGKAYSRLHQIQFKTVSERDKDTLGEYARKALSYTVAASWAYASGYFQRNSELLDAHYALPDVVKPPNDPLNAVALSGARLKGVDSDTYRGLGARTSPSELGRMLEVFLIQADKKGGITKKLANAAIISYDAKKKHEEARKALGKL